MRKYDYTDHMALGMGEIKDRIAHPILKDGTVTVFKIATPDEKGVCESFRCAHCLEAELFTPSDIDPSGHFFRQVEQGKTCVIAVPASDYDARTEYCSGCDKDITDFTPADFGDTFDPEVDPFYENGSGYSNMIGKELEHYDNPIMYQCPTCHEIDDLSALIAGWCAITGDGQYSTDAMENCEVLEGEQGAMKCGACNHYAGIACFDGTYKMYRLFERTGRNGERRFENQNVLVYISNSDSDIQIVGAVRRAREQFLKIPGEQGIKLHHTAKRLTDKNIVVLNEVTGEILFDLRYDYEDWIEHPDKSNDFVQCGACGQISRDSDVPDDNGEAICPNCHAHKEMYNYKGQEGRVGNPSGRYSVQEVAYRFLSGERRYTYRESMGNIILPGNASVMTFINQVNILLESNGKAPQGEMRVMKEQSVDDEHPYSLRTDDGGTILFYLKRVGDI